MVFLSPILAVVSDMSAGGTIRMYQVRVQVLVLTQQSECLPLVSIFACIISSRGVFSVQSALSSTATGTSSREVPESLQMQVRTHFFAPIITCHGDMKCNTSSKNKQKQDITCQDEQRRNHSDRVSSFFKLRTCE